MNEIFTDALPVVVNLFLSFLLIGLLLCADYTCFIVKKKNLDAGPKSHDLVPNYDLDIM